MVPTCTIPSPLLGNSPESESTLLPTDDDNGYEFYPDEVNIDCVASIPQHLLNDVIECYDKVKEYCKWCYYKRCKMGVVRFDSTSSRMICSICFNEWESVLVIPASDYCWNFGDFEYIPIAPWPRGKRTRDPFEYCAKEDHFRWVIASFPGRRRNGLAISVSSNCIRM